jgi:hypothetical protein
MPVETSETFVIWWRWTALSRVLRRHFIPRHLRVKPPARSPNLKLFLDKLTWRGWQVASCVAKGTMFGSFPGACYPSSKQCGYGRIPKSKGEDGQTLKSGIDKKTLSRLTTCSPSRCIGVCDLFWSFPTLVPAIPKQRGAVTFKFSHG